MRLSVRRAIKCLIILLSGITCGILFTTSRSMVRSSRGLPPGLMKQNDWGNATESLLFRIQRSAKSIETRISQRANGVATEAPVRKNRRATELTDVFISIKTTGSNHRSRVAVQLETWINNTPNQTYIFTDEDDDSLTDSLPDGHVINTNCSRDHGRRALNCKMAQEFDMFITKGSRWFCHVDDDTYINTVKLVEMLRKYNHTQDWYLGKPSLGYPIEVADRNHPGQRLAFWFATGGAGFCISKALALKMIPHAGGGRLMRAGEFIRLPDDCTVGYIINFLLHKELTVINEFHSHLEALSLIPRKALHDQITFGYLRKDGKKNIVDVLGFTEDKDPTRFWSIHCHLYPLSKSCLDHRLDWEKTGV